MTSTQLANLALSHLGISSEIASLDTENSQEANCARRFFSLVQDQILRDYEWPFATKIATLELVEEDPNDEWSFSYRYPSDCLQFRRILSGIRNDNQDSRAPYRIAQDATGSLILTDIEDADGEYTADISNPNYYPADVSLAFSFRLAAYMAPRLTGGDPFRLGDRAFKMFEIEVSRAFANAKNEEQKDRIPESELTRVRDGGTGISCDLTDCR